MIRRIADLCCCAGGASEGLHQAFPDAEIDGFDLVDQPHYPFRFHRQDALEVDLEPYDFVWASFPCQSHTWSTARLRNSGVEYPDILTPGLAKLKAWGGPFIAENTAAAPLDYSARLCGLSFGLDVLRHRKFQAPFLMLAPPHVRHRRKVGYADGDLVTVAGKGGNGKKNLALWRKAMGIDWMEYHELTQAIPPVYAKYLAGFIPA